MTDNVNHPPHYTQHPSGVECIEITRHMNFNLGNAIKYLWRADLKNGIEDLEKAIWYINDEINRQKALVQELVNGIPKYVVDHYEQINMDINDLITECRHPIVRWNSKAQLYYCIKCPAAISSEQFFLPLTNSMCQHTVKVQHITVDGVYSYNCAFCHAHLDQVET